MSKLHVLLRVVCTIDEDIELLRRLLEDYMQQLMLIADPEVVRVPLTVLVDTFDLNLLCDELFLFSTFNIHTGCHYRRILAVF